MYTIKQYLKDIDLLKNSLVIKHNNIGVLINQGLYNKYGIEPPEDPHEWKYYLNIAGIKHSTNNDVKIRLIETAQEVSLTKELLIQYPATQKELDARLNSYNELIQKYPEDIGYINGCINPVDIDYAINAKNGYIISYSTQYIEEQELSIISELSKDIYRFFERWYIIDYNIVDELYMASVLTVLYSNLNNMIFNKRLSRVYTSEVHSFHLEHFFRSHLDIWEGVKQLNKNTIMWLYNNLVSLINNSGKEETLEVIINKILTPNGIGLGTYDLLFGGIEKNDTDNILESVYKLKEPNFIPTEYNAYYNRELDKYTIEEVIKKEVNLITKTFSKEDIILETLINKAKNDLGKITNLTQNTKILDFGKIELFKLYNNSLIETILDNWLYLASTDKYINNVDITDPNTKDVYNLSPYEGILLFYYLLFRKFGNETINISGIKYRNKVVNSISKTVLLDKLLSAKGNEYAADIIVNNLPMDPGILTNKDSFNSFINDNIILFAKVWLLDSNVNNTFLTANIKRMVAKIFDTGSINLNPDNTEVNLADYLESLNISINIDYLYDIDKMLITLFKEFTGFNLDEKIVIEEIYNNYRNLINKLTSYTTKLLDPLIEPSEMAVAYSSIQVNQTLHGYIGAVDANIIKVIEDNNSMIRGLGNNFIENVTADNNNLPPEYIFDIFNHIKLVSKDYEYGAGNSNVRDYTLGTMVESRHASYIKYTPDVKSTGNNSINDYYVVGVNNIINNSLGLVRDDKILYNYNYDQGKSYTYIENLGRDTTPYIPNINTVGNADIITPNAVIANIDNNITTGNNYRNDTVYMYKPYNNYGTYTEILGMDTKPYIPNINTVGNATNNHPYTTMSSIDNNTTTGNNYRDDNVYTYKPYNNYGTYTEILGKDITPYTPNINTVGNATNNSPYAVTSSIDNNTATGSNYRDDHVYSYRPYNNYDTYIENLGKDIKEYIPAINTIGNATSDKPYTIVSNTDKATYSLNNYRNDKVYAYKPYNKYDTYTEILGSDTEEYGPNVDTIGNATSNVPYTIVSNTDKRTYSLNNYRDNAIYVYKPYNKYDSYIENLGKDVDEYGPDVNTISNTSNNVPKTIVVDNNDASYSSDADPELIGYLDETYSDKPQTSNEPGNTVTENVK